MELMKLILRDCCSEVLLAENGEEGVKSARENLPDVIFMDIQMPGMDGIQAMGIIKADPLTAVSESLKKGCMNSVG